MEEGLAVKRNGQHLFNEDLDCLAFRCHSCPYRSSTADLLERHQLNMGHSAAKKRRNSGLFRCLRCGKSYSRRDNLQSHSYTHGKKAEFVCNQCGNVYWQPLSLKGHKYRVHSNKDYGCPHCGKKFHFKSHLQKHLIGHLNMPIEVWKCPSCQMQFGCKSLLDQHVSESHWDGFHSCDHCGLTFKFKSILVEHQRLRHSARHFRFGADGKATEEVRQLIFPDKNEMVNTQAQSKVDAERRKSDAEEENLSSRVRSCTDLCCCRC